MSAYHRTDELLAPILASRALARVKRAGTLTKIARASGVEYQRSRRSGLALTTANMACAELIEATGMWANEADMIRLAYQFFMGMCDEAQA